MTFKPHSLGMPRPDQLALDRRAAALPRSHVWVAPGPDDPQDRTSGETAFESYLGDRPVRHPPLVNGFAQVSLGPQTPRLRWIRLWSRKAYPPNDG